MAALLWTTPTSVVCRSRGGGGVLTHCTVYARPSCAQGVRGPPSDIAGSQRKDCRSLVHCQLRKLVSDHASNSIESALRLSHQATSKFRRASMACHARRIREFPLESQEITWIEVLSPRQRGRRNLGVPVVEASTGESDTLEEGKEEEAGERVAAIGIPAWKEGLMHALGALLVGTIFFGVFPAQATDALKTCSCLLKECRVELARCIADPGCAANVACLQTCNNRQDETECQIGCGDLFENQVVDQFNDCAVSRKGCVPQKKDEGRFPVPPSSALVQHFDTPDFTGKWYITSGLNRTFDTFDCQLHEFSAAPHKLTGKLNWRIPTPDGGFFTRSAMQNFLQKEDEPGVLYNHGNEFLHYQDDWYILSSKIEKGPDDYVFVYYRGSNDAWDGYGGAVVYTRSSTLPQSIVPELTSAAAKVGLDFSKFTTTDNTCGPEAPLFARLEKKVEEGEQVLEKDVEEEEMFLVSQAKAVVSNVGKFLADIVKGEIDLFNRGAEELKKDEELLLKELGDEEKKVLNDINMEARDIERLFGKAIPIRKVR